MGQLKGKINCPAGTHVDSTPSCAVYEDGSGYCFACTSYFRKIEGIEVNALPEVRKEPENLVEKFDYIKSLPKVSHRGLEFHHDSRGYYICWPKEDYYKLRLWAPKQTEPKYMGAKGHKKPWFVIKSQELTKRCLLVEGEINALSIKESLKEHSNKINILSPGGATSFYDGEMKKKIELFSKYDTLLVMVDKDEASVAAAINFHRLAKPYCSDIRIKLMDKGNDANEILVNYGKEKLYEEIMDM